MRLMKTALALALMGTSVWSSDLKEEFNWTRRFVTTSGSAIIHTPNGVAFDLGGFNMGVGKVYKFTAGSSVQDIVALEDGTLGVEQTLEQFRANLVKFGAVISSEQ